MKTVINAVVFTFALLWTVSAFGQACHNNNGGGYPGGGGYPNGQPYPQYLPVDPYGNGGQYGNGVADPYYAPQPPVANIAPAIVTTPAVTPAQVAVAAATPAQPAAKITVVAAAPTTAVAATTKPAANTGSLRIVADEPELDARIAQLAGAWKAVARRGAGELTTIELVLDNRGSAELTLPGADGQPATTKSRANFQNEELRLTGTGRVVSLGKLVDLNDRQMVLQLTEGTMTFVRL